MKINPQFFREIGGYFFAKISGHSSMKSASLSVPDIGFHGSYGRSSRGFTEWTLWNQIGREADRPACKRVLRPRSLNNSDPSGLIAGKAFNKFNVEKQPIACQMVATPRQAEKTGVPLLVSSSVTLV